MSLWEKKAKEEDEEREEEQEDEGDEQKKSEIGDLFHILIQNTKITLKRE